MLRIVFMLLQSHALRSDELEYVTLAKNLVQEQSYTFNGAPTAYRPPGYPFFLALHLSVLNSTTIIFITQSLLEAVNCLLIFYIGASLGDRRIGTLAAILWALLPASIITPNLLLSETLFTTLLLGFVILLLQKPLKPILLGLSIGTAALIKPQMLLVAAVFGIWAWKEVRWKSINIAAGVCILLISPWVIRNMTIFEEPILTTNGGVNFWIGNNPEANGSYKYPVNNPLDSISNEIRKNETGYRLGMEFIMNHPIQSAIGMIKKWAFQWSSHNYLLLLMDEDTGADKTYIERLRAVPITAMLLVNVPFAGITALGILGFFSFRSTQQHFRTVFLLLLISWTSIHIIYFGAARFNYPLLPIFTVTASLFLVQRNEFPSGGLRSMVAAGILIAIFFSILAAEFLLAFL